MNTKARPEQLLSFLYLSSPALPIGAFAYSQGLEKAIELEWVNDRASLTDWCRDVMTHGMRPLDLPLLKQLSLAVSNRDQQALNRWNAETLAYRESHELVEEELHLGNSMTRLLKTQGLLKTLEGELDLPGNPTFLCSFALMGAALELPDDLLRLSFLWSWLENQVTVACKTIPLGQTEAQQVLLMLRPVVAQCCDEANKIESSEIGASLPGQALLSALHETQYSRLFRS